MNNQLSIDDVLIYLYSSAPYKYTRIYMYV